MKLSNITLYEKIRFILNGGIFAEPIMKALSVKKNESVLDFGCGTGAYSQTIEGRYFGLEINQALVNYARSKYGSHRKTFLNGTLQDLLKKRDIKSFDKGLIVNVLHHLNDEEININLTLLKKVIKKRLIIVDMDKEGANLFQKFLFLLDDGQYIRSESQFRQLIQKHFIVKRSTIFFSTTKSVRLCMFYCIPI